MIPFKVNNLPNVSDLQMNCIYEKIKTPNKFGAVVKWDTHFTDSPTVFFKDGYYYMYFIAIDKDCNSSGYETHLAKSTDLLSWEYIGTIFRRNDLNHWDSKQCAGYAAYPDITFGGTNELQMVNGSYYISYLAGNSDGYEPDPLFMGLAKSSNPIDPDGFTRFEKPILRPDDADSRAFERKTLYKSFIFHDKAQMTGYPYVNAYNAKFDGRERIFLAVSNDGESWERYGDSAVIDLISDDPDNECINGDPQIIKIDDIYVMFFFRYRKDESAFNTFAASYDLVHWNIWKGEPLVKREFPWECEHAHKTWFIKANNKNYHFYCAVNNQNERFIALATN